MKHSINTVSVHIFCCPTETDYVGQTSVGIEIYHLTELPLNLFASQHFHCIVAIFVDIQCGRKIHGASI